MNFYRLIQSIDFFIWYSIPWPSPQVKRNDEENSLSILDLPVSSPSTSRPTRRSFQIENIIKRIEVSQKKIINFEQINQRVLKLVEAERAKKTTAIEICKEQLNQFVSADVHSEF